MDLPIIFNAGMPRSGSTLIQNLLAQNPKFYCTGTNDVLDMVNIIRDRWMQLPGFVAQGIASLEGRICSTLAQMYYGFFKEEISQNKIIFDKNRGYLGRIRLIEKILGRKIKVIVTVRDIRDVVASFEKLHRSSVLTDFPSEGVDFFRKLTVTSRAERQCSIEYNIGYWMHCLQDVYEQGLDDRLVLVPYSELTRRPVETIIRVCEECQVAPFTCNPFNVEQKIKEDDTVYGMDLHKTRSIIEADSGNAWIGILPQNIAEALDSQFNFIQVLSRKRYLA